MVSNPRHKIYPTSSGAEMKGFYPGVGAGAVGLCQQQLFIACFLYARPCALAEDNDVEQRIYSPCSLE